MKSEEVLSSGNVPLHLPARGGGAGFLLDARLPRVRTQPFALRRLSGALTVLGQHPRPCPADAAIETPSRFSPVCIPVGF